MYIPPLVLAKTTRQGFRITSDQCTAAWEHPPPSDANVRECCGRRGSDPLTAA